MPKLGTRIVTVAVVTLLLGFVVSFGPVPPTAVALAAGAEEYVVTTILPTTGHNRSKAFGVNNLGQVVGRAHNYDAGSDKDIDREAFIWDQTNGVVVLPTLNGEASAWGVNDSGFVSGFSFNSSGYQRAVRWDSSGGTIFEIGTLANPVTAQNGDNSTAYDINNSGQVVGFLRPVKGAIDVMVWHPDSGTKKVAQLNGTFPGAPRINDVGQVFYWQARRPRFTLFGRRFLTAPPANYLWDPQRGSIALDACVPTQRGATLSIADLNNHGCLVGAVESDNGSRTQGVLLEPIPERWGD